MNGGYKKGSGDVQLSSAQREPTEEAKDQEERHKFGGESPVGEEEGDSHAQRHDADRDSQENEGVEKASNAGFLEAVWEYGSPQKTARLAASARDV